MNRERSRALILALIGLLYVLSIPWYRESGDEPTLVFGLPGWVFVALACYVLIALLNAAAWLLSDLSDEPGPEPDEAEP